MAQMRASEMIFGISIALAAAACVLLIFFAEIGVLSIYIARPFVDTAWETQVLAGLKLTELFSVLVPLITLALVIVNFGTSKSVLKMPFVRFWAVYLLAITFFSINIGANSSAIEGVSVFFRYLNGFVGFYIVQAYVRDERRIKLFFMTMVIAGLFPIGQGIFEAVTGHHWKITEAEGSIRNIGMYHDAITIRYYGLQTILATAACLGLKTPRNRIARLALIGILFGSLLVVFKALSKSGMATLAAWSAIWSYGRKSWLLPIALVTASIFIVPVYFEEISDTVYKQFHKEIGVVEGKVSANRSFAGRWYIWEEMWKQWESFSVLQKMFGSGYAAFGAHNDYMQMLFTGGYFGVALYVSFLLAIAWNLVRIYLKSNHILGTLALMAFSMWILDTIGLVPSLYSGYQWFVWGVIGLCLRHERDSVLQRKLMTRESLSAKVSPPMESSQRFSRYSQVKQ